jgi:hypothetical protein
MFVIVEVAIGVIFVYLMLALLVAATNEVVASLLGLRARTLARAIAALFGEDGRQPGPRTEAFYRHPLIMALSGGRRPSYIPPATFAAVAPEVLSAGGDSAQTGDGSAGRLSAVGLTLPADGKPDAKALEVLFQATMDRAVGWYKRQLQVLTLAVSFVVVLLSNADTIQIANALWTAPTLRASVVEAAQRRTDSPPPTDASVIDASYQGTLAIPVADEGNAERLADAEDRSRVTATERELLEAIVGWGPDYRVVNDGHCRALQSDRDRACVDGLQSGACRAALERIVGEPRCAIDGTRVVGSAVFPGAGFVSGGLVPIAMGHLLGWFMTIAAISLGAPFWFDLLKGVLNVRGAGNVPKPAGSGQ